MGHEKVAHLPFFAFGYCINFCIYATLRTRAIFSWAILYIKTGIRNTTVFFYTQVFKFPGKWRLRLGPPVWRVVVPSYSGSKVRKERIHLHNITGRQVKISRQPFDRPQNHLTSHVCTLQFKLNCLFNKSSCFVKSYNFFVCTLIEL